MALRDRLRTLAGQAQDDVLGLFDRWQAGGISESEFVAAAAAALARANGRAQQLGDRSAAIQLSRLLRREMQPDPTDFGDHRPRLTESLTTLLGERPEVAVTAAALAVSQRSRLARLARSEPLQRGRDAVRRQLQAAEVGWVRATGPDPCPLCQEWDDGQVRPASVDMPDHPNCSCIQRPARL